jgi:hypothetical protein
MPCANDSQGRLGRHISLAIYDASERFYGEHHRWPNSIELQANLDPEILRPGDVTFKTLAMMNQSNGDLSIRYTAMGNSICLRQSEAITVGKPTVAPPTGP